MARASVYEALTAKQHSRHPEAQTSPWTKGRLESLPSQPLTPAVQTRHHCHSPPSQRDGPLSLWENSPLIYTHDSFGAARVWRRRHGPAPGARPRAAVALGEASAVGEEWTKGVGDAGGRWTVSPFLSFIPQMSTPHCHLGSPAPRAELGDDRCLLFEPQFVAFCYGSGS